VGAPLIGFEPVAMFGNGVNPEDVVDQRIPRGLEYFF
jgi:hypothetical protein